MNDQINCAVIKPILYVEGNLQYLDKCAYYANSWQDFFSVNKCKCHLFDECLIVTSLHIEKIAFWSFSGPFTIDQISGQLLSAAYL
jgi:hypothetical protein